MASNCKGLTVQQSRIINIIKGVDGLTGKIPQAPLLLSLALRRLLCLLSIACVGGSPTSPVRGRTSKAFKNFLKVPKAFFRRHSQPSTPQLSTLPVRPVRPGTETGTGATSTSPNVYRPGHDGTPPAPQGPPPCVLPVFRLCAKFPALLYQSRPFRT
jgi:hypothetical protein